MAYDEAFMRAALKLSRRALTEAGTEPFGAVIVKDGKIVGSGLNHSLAHFDPTSHGEIEAIRDACGNMKTVDLTGTEMYTSCEPCAMCVAVMEVAGISRLYYAASMEQSGLAFEGLTETQRHPINVDQLRIEAGSLLQDRRIPATQSLDAEATAILIQWARARKECR